LHRVAVPVVEEDLTREVRLFRALLEKRTTNEYRIPGRRLYEWLIAPLRDHAAMKGVDTLVFVPDGVLRLIPFSALHDGREFLISKFAVVVTPSLTLADARPMKSPGLSILAGGLTSNRVGLASLPGVKVEVSAVDDHFRTKVLLDRSFTSREIERHLRRGGYGGLHIASHAVISPDVDKSYLLAADGKLSMERLGQIVGLTRFRDQPMELLFLSGCETAVGDDRAALGLAGVALRAGAKSAVATLWHVNDDSTSGIVSRFYELLASGGMSKAKALQQAQKELLRHTWYGHPGYWSPFLLINNWL
jgi:CHAT domain-containing protein